MDANNIAYIGKENSISALVENCDCDKVFLKTDNGKILKQRDCSFIWNPVNVGKGTVNIYKVNKKDTIFNGSKEFRVKTIKYKFWVLGSESDSISYSNLLFISKPIMVYELDNMENWINPPAEVYSIIAKRGDTILFSVENKGMDFTDETKVLFRTLQKNDVLLFFNIKSKYIELNSFGNPAPVQLIISD